MVENCTSLVQGHQRTHIVMLMLHKKQREIEGVLDRGGNLHWMEKKQKVINESYSLWDAVIE